MSFVATAVIATTASVGFTYQAGRQQAASLKGQAAAQELEARVAELGVKQTAARRMEALLADLGAIRTRRATQNVGVGGSALVAEKGYEKEYLQALRADILNQRYGIVSRNTNAAALRQGAKATMTSTYAGMFGDVARGFGNFAGGAPGIGSTDVGSGSTSHGSKRSGVF